MNDHGLTCIHTAKGLCPQCQADYEEDEDGFREFGAHPDGEARWLALLADMEASAAGPTADGSVNYCAGDGDDFIPF